MLSGSFTLPQFEKPSDDGIPPMPSNLTEISDAFLMDLFAKYVAWQNFIDQESVDIEIAETRAASNKDIAVARAMASSDEKQVAQQRAKTVSNTAVVSATNAWIMAKQHRKAMAVQKDALERWANLVSRELSRRIGRGPTQRRSDRWRP